jgi:hypothetical protein
VLPPTGTGLTCCQVAPSSVETMTVGFAMLPTDAPGIVSSRIGSQWDLAATRLWSSTPGAKRATHNGNGCSVSVAAERNSHVEAVFVDRSNELERSASTDRR